MGGLIILAAISFSDSSLFARENIKYLAHRHYAGDDYRMAQPDWFS